MISPAIRWHPPRRTRPHRMAFLFDQLLPHMSVFLRRAGSPKSSSRRFYRGHCRKAVWFLHFWGSMATYKIYGIFGETSMMPMFWGSRICGETQKMRQAFLKGRSISTSSHWRGGCESWTLATGSSHGTGVMDVLPPKYGMLSLNPQKQDSKSTV